MVELEGREEFVCGGRNAVRNEEGGCTDGCDDSFVLQEMLQRRNGGG